MRCEPKTVYDRLNETYKIREEDYIAYYVWIKYKDCFKVLIATILSQNSTDKSALKAYQNLEREIGVSPNNLASTSLDTIESAIRVAGLYKTKARRIKEISQHILNNYGDL